MKKGGTWVAQSVEYPTSAQVIIWWFVSSSPASGSVLKDWSMEPASDSVSLSLCLSPTHILSLSLSLSLSKMNKHERQELRCITQALFNALCGSIFCTFHSPTYFPRCLVRFSDIYMASLRCLSTMVWTSPSTHTARPSKGGATLDGPALHWLREDALAW